jgi:dihydroorotate dehydrogenase
MNLFDCGVRTFHLSNTIPSERGGISGDQLREQNLKQVEMFSSLNLPKHDINLIVGGGIYKPEHVRQYRSVGATKSFSLSTVWFTPWRVKEIIKEVRKT